MKKPKWYAVREKERDGNVWTISLDPIESGWNTDGGCDGYGLPESVAKEIVEILNRTENFTGDIFSKWVVKYNKFYRQ